MLTLLPSLKKVCKSNIFDRLQEATQQRFTADNTFPPFSDFWRALSIALLTPSYLFVGLGSCLVDTELYHLLRQNNTTVTSLVLHDPKPVNRTTWKLNVVKICWRMRKTKSGLGNINRLLHRSQSYLFHIDQESIRKKRESKNSPGYRNWEEGNLKSVDSKFRE